jgi:hypothetical protein
MAEEKAQPEEAAVEVLVEDQVEEKAKPKRRRPSKPKEPGLMDEVRVRFHGEMGIVAGQVVRDGFVVTCLYHQYLEARKTGGEAYELVK